MSPCGLKRQECVEARDLRYSMFVIIGECTEEEAFGDKTHRSIPDRERIKSVVFNTNWHSIYRKPLSGNKDGAGNVGHAAAHTGKRIQVLVAGKFGDDD